MRNDSKPPSHLGQVFLIVFIDLIGFSVIFPLVPQMLDHYLALEGPQSFVGGLVAWFAAWVGDGPGATFAVYALFGGFLGSLYSGLQFLFAPFWGRLSDRIGRRPTILVTLAGTALSYLVWFFAGSFGLLVAARLLGGVMSGNISTVSAVIGDTTSGRDRAKGMGVIGMAIGLGFILGPALGGIGALFDLTAWNAGLARFGINPFSVPAGIALVLATVNLLWVMARFHETLPESVRAANAAAHESAGKDERGPSLHPFRQAKRLRHPGLRRTNWTYFLYLTAFSAVEFTLTFLTLERLGFTPTDNAGMFVYVGLWIAIVQGGLIRRLAPRFGEKRLAIAGMALPVPGFLLIGLAQSVGQLYLGLTFMAIGSAFTMPTLGALASRYAPADRQGLAMGSFRSAGALSRAVGPILGGLFFWRLGSASPYVAAAIFLVLPLILAAFLPPVPEAREAPKTPEGAETPEVASS